MRHRLKQLPVLPAMAFSGIVLLAASLRLVRLEQNGFGTPYYAAAVRSMSLNLHNLFFAAFDPSGLLAIDKPPIAFWLQVASAKLLGFTGFALHAPQAIEGVVAVALLYHLVRRSFGLGAGLLAGLFLAVTPISVAIDRSNNTDSCLVLMQLLAALPLIVAVERASLPLLALAAVVLGIGFNVKMAAALLVLPGFVALYLLDAPAPWGRRIAHLAVAVVVLVVVSLSWAVAVDLTPEALRPYVDSTHGNSVLELAIGHNAFDRFVRPDWLDIVRPPSLFSSRVPLGPSRLADPLLASQIGWLVPLVLTGLWMCRTRATVVLWGGWAGVCVLVFGFAEGIFLPYYLSDMAPPLAALAAIGLTSLRGTRSRAILTVMSVAWQVAIVCEAAAVWRVWLIAAPVVAALIATPLLFLRSAILVRAAAGLAIVALLIAPIAWSLGPAMARSDPTSPIAELTERGLEAASAYSRSPVGDGLGNRTRLWRYLNDHRGETRYVLATTAILEASSIVIRTGEPVMVLGGYTGVTPVVRQAELARHVTAGEVRFVLIGGIGANDPASPLHPLIVWVRDHGREIAPAAWRPRIQAGLGLVWQRRAGYLAGLRLYDLAPE